MPVSGPDYLTKYREFKYQETLFELFARQYEIARVDESREGALIQVVDPATRAGIQEQAQTVFIASRGHGVEPAGDWTVHPGAPFLAQIAERGHCKRSTGSEMPLTVQHVRRSS